MECMFFMYAKHRDTPMILRVYLALLGALEFHSRVVNPELPLRFTHTYVITRRLGACL